MPALRLAVAKSLVELFSYCFRRPRTFQNKIEYSSLQPCLYHWMNKRTLFLLAAALVLGLLYVTYFTDLFRPKKIRVFCRVFPAGAIGRTSKGMIAFYLDKPYTLTAVEVISEDEARVNPHPHPVWYLVAKGGKKKHLTSSFEYGAHIAGMTPDLPQSVPEPLDPYETYRLLVQTGNGLRGEVSFQPPPGMDDASQN